jgi:hypothetical protein
MESFDSCGRLTRPPADTILPFRRSGGRKIRCHAPSRSFKITSIIVLSAAAKEPSVSVLRQASYQPEWH